jgi:NTE family protein
VSELLKSEPGRSRSGERSVALALGGGGARGLAHLGVLEVLEAEGIRPTFLAGTSIGGLVGALSASAIPSSEIVAIARDFRFPRRFVPGRVLTWEKIFPSAVALLEGRTFEDLGTPLVVSAVDLFAGEEVMLHSGPLLPAIRATCAVPGVLPPERLDGRCLVDGGVMNVLPVDLAWSWEPEIVIAVNIVASPRRTVRLDSRYARIATALGRIAPNPLTAHLTYDTAMRAVEVALDRQRALAIAMTGPEVLIDVDLGDVSIGDFHRLNEVVEIGRRATQAAVPRLRAALLAPACITPYAIHFALHIDPVCRMAISPGRARAQCERDGITYYFCSVNCRDSFERHGDHYGATRPACGAEWTRENDRRRTQ